MMWKGNKKRIALISILSIILLWALLPIPNDKPAFSKQLYSEENELISAIVSSDQQWCFPLDEAIPDHLKACIILYEDEYIHFHPGINPISIVKSMITNYKAGRTVRGASTLTMQVMRMKNKNAVRSWSNKIWEAFSAIKYSLLHSDDKIIKDWCEIAPFGGNTIGLKAASLRYFKRPLHKLSWAEYALLTVMPNGPSTANLTKNRDKLKQKRDFLLKKLNKKGYFDASDLQLYMDEDLPEVLQEIPQNAYHLLLFLAKSNPDKTIFHTTVNKEIQDNTLELIQREGNFLQSDDINNIATVVLDVQNNTLLAYHGNIRNKQNKFSYVDVAQAPRSYGSLLKPVLYAFALDQGAFLPHEFVADIPTAIGDFQPRNFDKKYRGAVPLSDILLLSLNVPAVRLLNYIGLQSFYNLLENLNLAYLNRGAAHYGLSLILGGGESSLWDLSRIYKGLAQNYLGMPNPFGEVRILNDTKSNKKISDLRFSAFAIEHTVNTMADLTRPREEKSWDLYDNNYKVAWKTGTSYGHKDAWAIGFNGKYVVGVWVGNERGEGRFNLTGISKAAPIMFKIFNNLPSNTWFSTKPVYSAKDMITVCKISGKIAGQLCKKTIKMNVEHSSQKYIPCNYHKEIWMDQQGRALSDNCLELAVRKDTLFILPSYIEYYYKEGHPTYLGLPDYNPGCVRDDSPIKILYPVDKVKIFLPRSSENVVNQVIMKAYHRDPKGKLFWFVNDQYLGSTSEGKHEMLFHGKQAKYQLQISDESGNVDIVHFELL